MHLSISDHSLIYVVRKAHYVQTDAKIVEARTMRNFNSENFLNDLNQQLCAEVCHNAADPNKMWQICKFEGWKKEFSLGYWRVNYLREISMHPI